MSTANPGSLDLKPIVRENTRLVERWRGIFRSFSAFERRGIYLLVLINSVSIFGYGTFGLHPEWVAVWSWVPRVFALAYPLFAQLQILVAFAIFVAAVYRHTRWDWISLFIATFVLSLLSEWTGTTYGIPFGKYEYTHLLGPKILDKVPYLIPISWFFMGFASYGMVVRIQGRRFNSALFRVVFGSLLLLTWDLTLDPAMSFLTPFWLWENPGFFYGMPALNLVGWFVTGLVILGAFELLGGQEKVKRLPADFSFVFYMANLMLPLGMVVVAGLGWALVVTCLVLICYYALFRYFDQRA
jgi:putative membrane protein